MKKKVLLLMGLSLMLLATACGKKETDLSGTSDSNSEASVTRAPGVPTREDYNVDDYIKLGTYKGVKVSVDKLLVTDSKVEAEISSELINNNVLEEITDRNVVQNGDVVNIDFEGLKDGVAFEGGTSTDYNLTIGSNSFIEGFESGLIGTKIGDKVKLDLTFPENYGSEDLAGQDVVFNVTINKIQKYVVPVLTEDYVKNNTDYASIAEYKKAIRERLEAESEQTLKDDISNSVVKAIVNESKISSYPQTLMDYYTASYTNYMEQTLSTSYGMTIEQYIQALGTTQEDYDANLKSIAENYAALEMVERAIAKAEGMTITDEEYAKSIDQYVSDFGATSEEELLTYVSKEQIKDDMLLKKALDFAVNNAVVTVNEVEPTPIVQTPEVEVE